MKYTKPPFTAVHIQLSRKVVKVQSAKIQELQIIINKEHDRGLVAFCILAQMFPINQLLVGNTLVALQSENPKYSYTPSLKTLRDKQQWWVDPAQSAKCPLDSGF